MGPMADLLSTARRRAMAVRPEPVRPSELVRQMLGAGGAAFAQEKGLEGAVYLVSAGSISAALAVAEGFWKIQLGLADIVVAGGAECPLHEDIINTFASAGVLANAGAMMLPAALSTSSAVAPCWVREVRRLSLKMRPTHGRAGRHRWP